MSAPGVGTHLGSYRIEALLGRGGMGVVYRAQDLRLGRKVALKLLAAHLTEDARFRSRFLAESRLAASIDHAAIIPIYEAGESDGHLYIAMRYVEGTDLGALLRREGALAPERAVDLVAQLAGALDAAHQRGLVHRDVKPSNALIAHEGATDHVYLADFGLTRHLSTAAGTTATDQLVGTIDYLAPERIAGAAADHRADLYALGCVLYECLTGEVPFPRDSEAAAIYAHLEDDPPRPSERRPGMPEGLDDVVARALAKDPEARFASGAALVAAARAALTPGAAAAGHVRARRRPPLKPVAGLIAIIAALVVAGLVLIGRGGHVTVLAVADADAIAVIDPRKGSLLAAVPAGASPAQMASAGGAMWVANSSRGTVSRIDLRTRAVTQTVGVGDGPGAVAVGAGGVWVVNTLGGTLSWISPAINQVVRTIPVGNGPSGVCVAAGAVWVASTFDRTIVRFDPIARRTTTTPLDDPPTHLACGGGSVWAGSQSSGTVTRLSTDGLGAVAEKTAVGRGPSALAWYRGGLWVANTTDGTVSRIDGESGTQSTVIPLAPGARPTTLVAGAGGLWVGDERAGTVARIDDARNATGKSLRLGKPPQGLAVVDGTLWVSLRATGVRHRGGILHVVHPGGQDSPKPTAASLDPAQAYDGNEILPLTNDGLLTFRRAGGRAGSTPVADLAVAVPAPTDGGRTYAFRLRPGSRYSDGAPVRASDIRRGIERVLLRSSGVPFYTGIRGAARCRQGHARCDMSAGIAVDDRAGTIAFHLTAPDADFLNKLALPAAVAVPAGTQVGPLRRPLPATGPYMVDRVGRVIHLVRNRRFRPLDGRPDGYADAITIDCCAEPRASVESVRQGRADLLPADFGLGAELKTTLDVLATRYPGRLRATPTAATIYAFMNTQLAPFDNVDARRALNYAVDRAAFAALKGGARFAQPTCQFLPPNFPGFRAYCPYTANAGAGRPWAAPDLARARELVARSRTKGMRVTVVGSKVWFADEARLLGAALDRLGYRVRVHILPQRVDYFAYIEDPRRPVQIATGGWYADYSSAESFLEPIFGCKSLRTNTTRNVNTSRYCDARTETLMRRAQLAPPGEASDRLWARADRRVTDQAGVVPLINPRSAAFLSERAGNYTFSQQWGALYDQLWVR